MNTSKENQLSAYQLEQIIAKSKAYTSLVLRNKIIYPHPSELSSLSDIELSRQGFISVANFLKVSAKRKRGGNHPRPLPDANTVATEVTRSMANMPMATNSGNLVLGEWNMEFLDSSKAKYFSKTYAQIVPRHHLLFCEEVDSNGLDTLAQAFGYTSYCSVANTRGQAVGFLVHPRLKVIGQPKSYDNLANVQGIPDLRPAFRLDLEDTVTGVKFSAVVVHLKSMRGGPSVTSKVRYQQMQYLASDLGSNFSGIISGDFNTFLDNTNDTSPLVNLGFKLVNPTDHTTTQSMGGRLDGFFHLGLTSALGRYQVRPFFKNPLITRGLSDHGLLTIEMRLCNVKGANDPDCNTPIKPGSPFSDNPTDAVEVS